MVDLAADLEGYQRDRFVRAALAYLGTPYHHQGRVKGAGVDCATLLVLAAHDAGLVDEVKLPDYSPQWMLHRDEEKYLEILGDHCREITGPPLAGDIAIWKVGRTFSHAAIVMEWPQIIHAVVNLVVKTDDADKVMWLKFDSTKPRPMKLFSFWAR